MHALTAAAVVAKVYISWGKWVARCPADGCPQAEHFGADPNTGYVGGLTETAFWCGHCGLTCPAEWPPEEMCADAVRLLAMRPVPATRNWNRQLGEPTDALLGENVEHGLLDAEELLPEQWTPGDGIRLMQDGLLTPHARKAIHARALAQILTEADRGAQLRAPSLLAIGA